MKHNNDSLARAQEVFPDWTPLDWVLDTVLESDTPATVYGVSQRTMIEEEEVRELIDLLENSGEIEKDGQGRYRGAEVYATEPERASDDAFEHRTRTYAGLVERTQDLGRQKESNSKSKGGTEK